MADNRGRRHPAPASFFFLCLLSLAACGGEQGSATSQPGPAQKLQAAAAAMRTTSAFRFTADVVSGTQQVHVSGEFSAPDGLHETVQIGSNTVEVLRIGSRAFRRDSPAAAWQVVAATTTTPPTDPRSAFDVLAKAGDVHLQGSSYAFSLTKTAAASLIQGSTSVTGAALLAGGRITQLSYQAASPPVSVHLSYSGFNATPPVTAPPGL